jgi:toxin FitB
MLTIAEYRKGIAHLPPGDKRWDRLPTAVIALETRFSGRVLSVSNRVDLRWGALGGEVKRLTGNSPR